MLQLQQITDKYDLVGNFGYRNFGNYEDGNGIEVPSSFKSTDYGIKAGYNITEAQRVKLHWRQSFGRDVLHAGLPMDTEYDNSSILSLSYRLSFTEGIVNKIKANAYYSYVDHLMHNFNRPSFMKMEASSPVESTTMGGKVEIEWNPFKNFSFFSGLDGNHIARDGVRNRLVKLNMDGEPLPMPMEFTDKIWQDSYINDMGVFNEVSWYTSDRTTLNAGIRYDWISTDIKDPEADFAEMYDLKKRTEENISWTMSVRSKLSDHVTFEAAYGRGVRSASMTERYINHFNVGQDPYEYIGNPDLKPEVNNQFEIGFKGKTKESINNSQFSFDASFYYSFIDNMIVAQIDESLIRKYNPMMEPRHPKVFGNIDKAYKTGFEMGARVDFDEHYYLKSEIAYVYAKNEDLNESIPLTPPFNGKFVFGYESDRYWANMQVNMTGRQHNIARSFGETKTEEYETLDVKVGGLLFNKFTVGLAIMNVFDRAYHNHLNFSYKNQDEFNGEAIKEPGRNFTAFLQYKF
jgi:iron complex outermembrane receptor protein